ncbi:MAG: hypothetical protein CXZ00_13145 [Acidobacteria bacterium]|nr:MAG: hypothetical protein CXZ00_13145 [Acidobacteriota bacterium]
MSQCLCGFLHSALLAVQQSCDVQRLRFHEGSACGGFFNTNVEMPVRNSVRRAFEAVFMGV